MSVCTSDESVVQVVGVHIGVVLRACAGAVILGDEVAVAVVVIFEEVPYAVLGFVAGGLLSQRATSYTRYPFFCDLVSRRIVH